MRRNYLLVFASAALAVLVACSSKPQSAPRSSEPVTTGGGAALGSCVERYSPATLAKRSFAFDGTVKSSAKSTTETGADTVTFTVNHWYKGGSATEVTLKTYGLGGVTSAGSISGRAGEHMLVTGEEDNLWTCGFTQPYSDAGAAEWNATFGS
jgi:hypothetical protein